MALRLSTQLPSVVAAGAFRGEEVTTGAGGVYSITEPGCGSAAAAATTATGDSRAAPQAVHHAYDACGAALIRTARTPLFAMHV